MYIITQFIKMKTTSHKTRGISRLAEEPLATSFSKTAPWSYDLMAWNVDLGSGAILDGCKISWPHRVSKMESIKNEVQQFSLNSKIYKDKLIF
jgi:hypothetical protein